MSLCVYACNSKVKDRHEQKHTHTHTHEMESEEKDQLENATPFSLCTKLISFPAEIISNCILTLVSPFNISSQSRPIKSQNPKLHNLESVATTVFRGGSLLLGRIAMGFIGAAYVCMVLIVLMLVAAVLGVGLVRFWVEEPIVVTETLHFDYTDVHPTAVFLFGVGGGKVAGVPVGQTLYVSLLLLMPDSDYNREIGIFQVTVELISTRGDLIEKLSHPCMLHFSSWPIRMIRTYLMGIPLLLGITDETQAITFPILRNKEAAHSRTKEIRIKLIPRAGTYFLPQFYDAKILLKSRLPWTKQVVYSWKWTFYVWTTLYIYTIMLFMILVFYLKPVIYSILMATISDNNTKAELDYVSEDPTLSGGKDERDQVELLRRSWQRSKHKRKASGLIHGEPVEARSSASSMTVSRGETIGASSEEGVGDSESVCSPTD